MRGKREREAQRNSERETKKERALVEWRSAENLPRLGGSVSRGAEKEHRQPTRDTREEEKHEERTEEQESDRREEN